MNKQQEFLYIVQTTVIANGINMATNPEANTEYRHVFSATGVFGLMDDAIYASKRIPDGMTSTEAADEFLTYMLDNWRETEEAAGKERLVVPDWFARG